MGCSTAGEIFGAYINDNSISVAVIQLEKPDSFVKKVYAKIDHPDESFAAGKLITEKLQGENLKSIMILSDGLNVNGSELVKGVNKVLPKQVVVTGGLAGDNDRFQNTWIIKDGKPQSNYVCALGLYGPNIEIKYGSKGGWDSFGPERLVTKSKANVLYELDGKPALSLYKEYLGERASGLPATGLLFPLLIRESKENANKLERVPKVLTILKYPLNSVLT
ncbi:MAG: uncharacterized protein JWM09_163 [Francisellaceae bacterium]|nr:uncharacterized protein [Francisellaceae bacterium]